METGRDLQLALELGDTHKSLVEFVLDLKFVSLSPIQSWPRCKYYTFARQLSPKLDPPRYHKCKAVGVHLALNLGSLSFSTNAYRDPRALESSHLPSAGVLHVYADEGKGLGLVGC